MREINFEVKALELVAEVQRLSARGIVWGTPLFWTGISGIAVSVPKSVLGVTDVKEMQQILELAWAEHCLVNGVWDGA